jgi:hypothetical protein
MKTYLLYPVNYPATPVRRITAESVIYSGSWATFSNARDDESEEELPRTDAAYSSTVIGLIEELQESNSE